MTLENTPVRPTRLPLLRVWYWKMLYIIGGAVIYYLIGGLAPTSVSRGILRSAIVFLLVLLAARVFRGSAEPGRDPRPWWRMTSRPLAGFVLGGLTLLIAIVLAFYAYGVETVAIEHPFRSQEPYIIVTLILFALLGVLYLTSSLRLRSLPHED